MYGKNQAQCLVQNRLTPFMWDLILKEIHDKSDINREIKVKLKGISAAQVDIAFAHMGNAMVRYHQPKQK